MKKIMENVEALRNQKGYSQEYVASKLGIQQSAYSRIFNIQGDIKLSMLEKICEVLKVSMLDVLTYPDTYVLKDESLQKCNDCIAKDKIIEQLSNYIAILEGKVDLVKKEK